MLSLTAPPSSLLLCLCLCLLPSPPPQDVSPKYNAMMALVSRGDKTYGERLSECAAMDSFLLRRSKQEVVDSFPPSEQVSCSCSCETRRRQTQQRSTAVGTDQPGHSAQGLLQPAQTRTPCCCGLPVRSACQPPCAPLLTRPLTTPPPLQETEAIELASKLGDKAWAMEHLLGPLLSPEGASNRLKSEEARTITEHLYTPDRWGGGLWAGWSAGLMLGSRQQGGRQQGTDTFAPAPRSWRPACCTCSDQGWWLSCG